MKRNLIKALSMILVLVMVSWASCFFRIAGAPEMLPLFAPENLRVEAKDPGKPAIGFISSRECYVDIVWDESSISPYPAATYYNIYIREINKYGVASEFILRDTEKGLPSNINDQPYRLANLKPGTVYQLMVKAYYRVVEGSMTYTSPESPASNVISVLTDINLTVGPPAGTNHVRVEWDDVWTTNGRIDYKLYISENPNFANTQPIFLTSRMIGTSGPVFVNQATGRLEYLHPVRDPAKIYYVKLAPEVKDSEIYKNPETYTQCINTFILVKTTKVANTSSGTIWRLDWSAVNTGLSVELSKAYLIYKGRLGSTAAPEYVATVTGDTSFYVTVPAGDKTTYYRIVADIRDAKTQQEVFPIRITSDDIIVKEVDVPNTPPAPELVSEIRDEQGQLIASYDNLLGADTATILFRPQRKADGSIDTDIEYDIWLTGDSKYMDNPPDSAKLADSFKININDENFVVRDESGNIVGYKYKLSNLKPNSTYYFKIIAKKRFVDFVNGELTGIVCSSSPAYKIIITRTQGPIDQPVAPGKPPLRIKRLKNGHDAVTENSVVIQLKNKWYEKFDASISKWVYIDTSILSDPAADREEKDDLLDLISSIDAGTADRSLYRKIEYDEGLRLEVGCIKESELVKHGDLAEIPAEKITDFPAIPNDPDEVPEIPGDSRHNIDITVNGLESNTSYIIWVKAVRRNTGVASEPSDPIVVVTRPIIPEYPEYPTVPIFNYGVPYDRYVDLGWTGFRPEYTYYIAWSTTDDVKSAKKQIAVTKEDYTNYYYRLTGLEPNTQYYFWIRAESTTDSGQKLLSEWSDSYPLKTLPYLPPNPPKGFGIGNFEGAVGKNSISFEWLKEDNLEYILEIAGDPDFEKSRTFEAGKNASYTVTGLLSNHRYYARLFAYDADTDLKSAPSPVVTVRTQRSTDEYDSDQNTEDIIPGDFVEKDAASKGGTWNIRISGVNADRFVEQALKDNIPDYRLDVRQTPENTKRICLTISSRVLDFLTGLGENLNIETAGCKLVIRPNMLSADRIKMPGGKYYDFDYRITISTLSQPSGSQGLSFQSMVASVKIEACDGGNLVPVYILNKPLKIIFNYTGNWYREGVSSGYVYSLQDLKWEKCESTVLERNETGSYISVESLKTGDIGIAVPLGTVFDDLDGQSYDIARAIKNVSSLHRLKSIVGTSFRPSSNAVLGDAVRFMLDVLDYDYGPDYMYAAAKAGIINPKDMTRASDYCTREKAAAMAVRVFEIKTFNTATAGVDGLEGITDLGLVDPGLSQKVYFALKHGILGKKAANRIDPKGPITRGEVMLILERVLALVGELE